MTYKKIAEIPVTNINHTYKTIFKSNKEEIPRKTVTDKQYTALCNWSGRSMNRILIQTVITEKQLTWSLKKFKEVLCRRK